MRNEVVIYGDPVLRRKAEPVTVFDDALCLLAHDMIRVMRASNGVGLAAEQVGLTCALCVIDVPADADVDEPGGPRLNPGVTMPLVLVNPWITARQGEMTGDEGCLSFPALFGRVTRAYEVSIAFQDLGGLPRTATVRGLLSRAVQHELDHLRGVLLIDHFSAARKVSLALALKRLKDRTRDKLADRPAD